MLKRWGKELVDKCYLSNETLNKLDVKKYMTKLCADVEAKKVYIVKEQGWNIGHSSLAPQLAVNLTKQGLLIKLENTKPTRYRLPTKVKINLKLA